jgi:hypothetical protein
MPMAKRAIKPGTITTDDYYNEKFLRIEIEIKHLYEIIKLGFAETNRRFEDMNKRFDEMNIRIDAQTKRMDSFMIWSFGVTLTCTGLIIAAMKFWK